MDGSTLQTQKRMATTDYLMSISNNYFLLSLCSSPSIPPPLQNFWGLPSLHHEDDNVLPGWTSGPCHFLHLHL